MAFSRARAQSAAQYPLQATMAKVLEIYEKTKGLQAVLRKLLF
jgi:hypothetical protein